MKRLLTTCLGIALVAGTGCAASHRAARQRLIGKAAPGFSLSALDGQIVRLVESRGKPVLLAFWAYG